jgi:microcystin-dependent protein
LPTLLNYALVTEPFPLQAGTDPTKPAKLTVIASNPNPEQKVTIKKKISITLPIGSTARDLTATAPLNTVAPEFWTAPKEPTLGEGVAIYDFTPTAGHKDVTDQGLNFIFNDVVVNLQPGSCLIEITEVISDAEDFETNLSVAKFPPGWGKVSFGVDPANIQAGNNTKLDWLGPAKAEYKIEYSVPVKGTVWIPKQGDDPLGNEGTYPGPKDPPLTLEVTTTFTLHVWLNLSGRRYHATQQRTVTVIPRPPAIEYFRPRKCEGSECVINSDEFILEWEVKNAEPNQCQLTQEWPALPDTQVTVIPMPWKSKFVVVRPTQKETRYTLMVKEKSIELTATVNATLAPPVPVGTIVPYGALVANQLPPGWLYCNGNEYTKTQYPQLYPVIQDVYGKARSTNNGKLPDLRGLFVRGYDDGKMVDPGRVMGSLQNDAFKTHTHGQKVTANSGQGNAIRADFSRDESKLGEYPQGVQTDATGDLAETRPKNIACYFVIYAGVLNPAVKATDNKRKGKAKKDKVKGKKSAAGRGRVRTVGRRGSR